MRRTTATLLLVAWALPVLPGATRSGAEAGEGFDPTRVSERTKNYWAFRPIVEPELPVVDDPAWSANPVDRFIAARLAEKNLKPAPAASKREILRRASYDLTGLPPTLEEVQAFEADSSPDAFEKVVDRLLDSPRYGEKWGRHWLDLVRYAESNGYERDSVKEMAWAYRDYVIRAFNEDKPFDRFLLEQLAGDELDDITADSITATGYYRLGLWDDEPVDPERARYDYLDSILATTSEVMLGLTVGCARCHDHKIDPIPSRDYYRLLAFFQNISPHGKGKENLVSVATPGARRRFEERARAKGAAETELATEVRDIEQRFLAAARDRAASGNLVEIIRSQGAEVLGEEVRKRYLAARTALERSRATELKLQSHGVMAVAERGRRKTHVLRRGNPALAAEEVQPGFPEVLSPPEPRITDRGKTSGRRRALAEWIVRPDNPLTARVAVNRIWQFHFGRGIVRSSNNFGRIGERPTHPALLDWLAATFVKKGWSVKAMHRLIMLSRTYQMSSRGQEAGLAADPANDLFWRFDLRRLTAEEVRDSILAATGSLNLKMGGPSFYPVLPAEVLATSSTGAGKWGRSPEEERNRRSVYIFIRRSLQDPTLTTFDFADTDSSCAVRFSTTVPTQALLLLNSDFVNQQAEALAARLRREAGPEVEKQVARAFEIALSRRARAGDIARSLAFVKELREQAGLSAEAALDRFALLILNLNEFVFID